MIVVLSNNNLSQQILVFPFIYYYYSPYLIFPNLDEVLAELQPWLLM